MRKEMSRVFVFLLIGLFLFSSVGFALAQDEDLKKDAEDLGKDFAETAGVIPAFLKGAFGISEEDATPTNILTYLFMSIILFLLLYSVFDTMDLFKVTKGKDVFNVLISVAVTVITLIALPADLFNYIRPSFGAMGGAILTIIPFMVVLIFSIKTKSIAFAKMVWMFFGGYFIIFYFMAAGDVTGGAKAMYIIAGLAGLAMFWMIPMVRHLFKKATVDEVISDIHDAIDLEASVIKARGVEGRAHVAAGRAATG